MSDQQSSGRDEVVNCISRSMVRQLKSENIVFTFVSYSLSNKELHDFTDDDLEAIVLAVADSLTSKGYDVSVCYVAPSALSTAHRFIADIPEKQMT